LEEVLKEVDKVVPKEFGASPNTLQSIKGIGPVHSACIFSEIGDIHRFHTEDALAKFASLRFKR
jgi:transposase